MLVRAPSHFLKNICSCSAAVLISAADVVESWLEATKGVFPKLENSWNHPPHCNCKNFC